MLSKLFLIAKVKSRTFIMTDMEKDLILIELFLCVAQEPKGLSLTRSQAERTFLFLAPFKIKRFFAPFVKEPSRAKSLG